MKSLKFDKYRMLNKILKFWLGKELVLYSSHRNSQPIVDDVNNKKKFVFIPYNFFFRFIPFKHYDKRKYIVLYHILLLLSPKYILSINWIGREAAVFKLWSVKQPSSKSVVIQHGGYIGGIVTDIPHRHVHCDVFWVWGDYFKQQFEHYNQGKNVSIIARGNPIYNSFDRQSFQYSATKTGKVLLAPSGIKGERLNALYKLHLKLLEMGFDVYLKEHRFQSEKYAEIKNIKKITGDTYAILRENKYDFIVCDHGSIMLDAIFFKNHVLFFSASGTLHEYTENCYTTFLKNMHDEMKSIKEKAHVYSLIEIKAQEQLFQKMITLNSNNLEVA